MCLLLGIIWNIMDYITNNKLYGKSEWGIWCPNGIFHPCACGCLGVGQPGNIVLGAPSPPPPKIGRQKNGRQMPKIDRPMPKFDRQMPKIGRQMPKMYRQMPKIDRQHNIT